MLNDSFPYHIVIANSLLESAVDWLKENLPDHPRDLSKSMIDSWRTNYSILGETVRIYFRTQEDQALFALRFL